MTTDTPQGFSDLVGVEFTEIEAGFSRCHLTVTERVTNPQGVLHGAALYTMADTGMGAALYPDLEGDKRCATIEVKINYLQSVRDGRVTCETELLRKGRSVSYLESTLECDGDTVARATGSYAIYSP